MNTLDTFPAELQTQIEEAVAIPHKYPAILSHELREAIMDRGKKRPNKMPPSTDAAGSDSDSEAAPREQHCEKKVCPWCILGIEHNSAVTAAAEA